VPKLISTGAQIPATRSVWVGAGLFCTSRSSSVALRSLLIRSKIAGMRRTTAESVASLSRNTGSFWCWENYNSFGIVFIVTVRDDLMPTTALVLSPYASRCSKQMISCSLKTVGNDDVQQ
jgi:hypothetical protein